MNEFELIATWFDRPDHSREDVRLGMGDDGALLVLAPGQELVTASACISAVDPSSAQEADQIASRCYAQAESGLVKQQATPAWAILCLSLEQANRDWLQRFSATLRCCLQRRQVQLIGGDTTRGPTTVTLFLSGTRSRPAA